VPQPLEADAHGEPREELHLEERRHLGVDAEARTHVDPEARQVEEVEGPARRGEQRGDEARAPLARRVLLVGSDRRARERDERCGEESADLADHGSKRYRVAADCPEVRFCDHPRSCRRAATSSP
jgi:hypothetical protein